MGRRPEVFVRALSMAEGQRLQKITRTAKNPVKLRRAIVVLMSGQVFCPERLGTRLAGGPPIAVWWRW